MIIELFEKNYNLFPQIKNRIFFLVFRAGNKLQKVNLNKNKSTKKKNFCLETLYIFFKLYVKNMQFLRNTKKIT